MTETVKHTPWAVGPHPWPEQVGCCPLVGRPYSVHGTDNRNVAAANTLGIAHLIAAAPDMLEALKAAIANSDANIGPYGRTPEAQAVYDQVSDAIDKAEGRSHG